MASLKTCYLGIELDNPVIVAASGLTATPEGVGKAAEAGAGAIVLKSLFEEQLAAELGPVTASLESGAHPEAEAFLSRAGWDEAASGYLELVRGAKAAVRGIPIIASVNCRGTARWAEFAAKIEAAGADALELNLAFMPISTEEQGLAIEELAFRTVREVRAVTRLPIAVKLGSSYTNLANVAVGLAEAGAGALVLFNRFYRMDLDLETMSLVSGPFHSSPEDYHESLRWVAILAERAGCDLAAGTGIHDAEVALRLVAAGAAAVQVCSAIYKGGWRALGDIKKGMSAWLDAKGIAELGALKGRLSQWRSAKPEAYLRVQYIKALTGIS